MIINFRNISLTLFLILFSVVTSAVNKLSPYQVVDNTSKILVVAIRNGHNYFEHNPEKFYATITEILEPVVNFHVITHGVMGKYFKQATAEQRSLFLAQFKKALIRLYSKTFLSLGVESIEIVGSKPGSDNLKKQAVNMKVRTENGKSYSLIYSMKKNKKGSWLVGNMIIDGINLGLVYRNQFIGAMEQHQGNMDEVINDWLVIVGKDRNAIEQ